MLLLLWGWFRLEKGIPFLDLDGHLVVGSGLNPPTSILWLTRTLNTEPSVAGVLCVSPGRCMMRVYMPCGCAYRSLQGSVVVPTCGWRWAWLWSSGEKENRSGSQRRWSLFPSG